jgi:Fe2+ transport system protein FeoA
MNLNDTSSNKKVTVVCLSGSCNNLRDLGFCERINVTKLLAGRNIVCLLCGAKVAISRDLAQCVIVEEDPLD